MLNWLTRYASVTSELSFDTDGRLTESVLDVGCGPHGLACAAPDAHFVGIDVAFPEHVAANMTAFRSAPGPLPFCDASFDTVICLDVIEHIPAADRPGFVAELARVASRRVIVACPSEESSWSQDVLRLEYAARELPLPGWLNEHDEHGLPTVEEIGEISTSVPGCCARELSMANGLLAMLIVLGDMLPEFSPRANAEFRSHPREWLEVFSAARFGASNRRGYVIEHESPRHARVTANRIQDSVLAAVRCAECGSAGLLGVSAGAVCPSCARGYARDQSGALDLSGIYEAPRRLLAPIRTDKRSRLLLRPDWLRPQSWMPVLANYLARADLDGDHVLCLDAVDVAIDPATAQRLILTVCAATVGDADFPSVIVLDTPYQLEQLNEVRTVAELSQHISLASSERPVGPDAIVAHAQAVKDLCDSLRGTMEQRLYEIAPDPWISREPLVTVRIPTWGGARVLIERAIPSVLQGSYGNFEIVVCSDGPDAQARALVEAVGDTRVRFMELPERPRYAEHPWSLWQTGGAHAANAAQEQASGSFIAPLDHDDAFTVDHIDTLLTTAADSGADLVYGQALVEEAAGGWRTLGQEPIGPQGVTHGAAMYSSRLAHVGLDPDCWLRDESGDWNMYRRMTEVGAGVAFVARPVLVHFRERSSIGAQDDPAAERLHTRETSILAKDLIHTGLDWLLDIPLKLG